MFPQFPKRLSYKKASRWIETHNPTGSYAFEAAFWDDQIAKSDRFSRRVMVPLCLVVAAVDLAAAAFCFAAGRFVLGAINVALAIVWVGCGIAWGRMGRESR